MFSSGPPMKGVGSPRWARTSNPDLRRIVLYPIELGGHEMQNIMNFPESDGYKEVRG
jgi:hypothetical protein